MFRSLYTKTLYDKRGFIWGWALGVGALFGLIASFYSSIDMAGLEIMTKSIPKGIESIIGEMAAYGTTAGYIGNAIYGIRFEMLVIPMVIVLGVSLSTSEERSGKLYQLMAQPISRRRVITEKWLAGITAIGIIMLVAYVSIALVFYLVGVDVPFDVLNRISLMSVLFVCALFSLAFGLGMAFASKALSTIAVVAVVMGGYIVKGFAAQVDWVDRLQPVSIYGYYNTAELAKAAPRPIDTAVLAGIIIVSLLLAYILFAHRDIKEE